MNAIDDLPEGLDKRVALTMHQQGIELTPNQVREISRGAISSARNQMREKGYNMPDSDSGMLEEIREALAWSRFSADEGIDGMVDYEERIEISPGQFETIMGRVSAEMLKTSPKKWCVLGPDGETIQRYETEQAARDSCF